jgi:phosphotransferase system  glucose/maltose/N-acetylglucosamine-specific IIC component
MPFIFWWMPEAQRREIPKNQAILIGTSIVYGAFIALLAIACGVYYMLGDRKEREEAKELFLRAAGEALVVGIGGAIFGFLLPWD